MVLEKLSGRSVESRIGEPGFGDVRYVRAMLRQVLRALDRAYRELGARSICIRCLCPASAAGQFDWDSCSCVCSRAVSRPFAASARPPRC